MKIFPNSKIGRLSLWLFICVITSFLVANIFVIVFHQTGGNNIFDNLYISIPIISAVFLIIAAFFMGVASIVKQQEKAIALIVTMILEAIIIFFVIAEILLSH